MTSSLPPTPLAVILCEDSRLEGLLKAELTFLGARTLSLLRLPTSEEPLSPTETPGLLLADGDAFPLSDCLSLAATYACPLLLLKREEADLPLPSGVTLLRRPFLLSELEQRAHELLTGDKDSPLSRPPAPQPPRPSQPLLGVDIGTGIATLAGKPLSLTPAEQTLLSHLWTRRGETVPREELAALLKGGGNSVDVYVCRLRAKIEKPLGRRMLTTVRGQGYRLEL